MEPYFIMTVDVDPPLSFVPAYVIEDGTISLLKLLDKYAVRATFFAPAVVAERFPAIMEEIVSRRHEVSCHGLKHDPLEATLEVNKQIRMVKTATEIIQSITGVRPVGFRAPLFRVNRNCWIALQKNGYVYDSSVVSSPFFGNHRVFFPARPFFLPIPKANENHGLLEIPISANPFLPFPLGGTWMRIFGSRWSRIGVKLNFMSKTPVVFYVHPKDVIQQMYGHSRIRPVYGQAWHYFSARSLALNAANCMKMLDEIINYAKRSGAKFLTAYELARLFGAERARC